MGILNVNESIFISISGVFIFVKIVISKNDFFIGESDFIIENNISGFGIIFYVVYIVDGIVNYFIDGVIVEKYVEFCVNNIIGMFVFIGDYVLVDNIYINGICYFYV